jgi:hypothetical protein
LRSRLQIRPSLNRHRKQLKPVNLTWRPCPGIGQHSMLWWRRCLVIVPVLSFVALAMLWSCGGGSSGTSATPLPIALVSVAICAGPPFTPTPTPVPTKSVTPTPTPSPTPMCAALSSTSVASPGPFFFHAQGTFQRNNPKQATFRDVTNDASTEWFLQGDLTQVSNGIYNAPSANGCGCLAVKDGGLTSETVQVTIGNPLPLCTPCAQP